MGRIAITDPFVFGSDEEDEETPAERERRATELALEQLAGVGDRVASEGAAAMQEPAAEPEAPAPESASVRFDSMAHEDALRPGDDEAEVTDAGGGGVSPQAVEAALGSFAGRRQPGPGPQSLPAPAAPRAAPSPVRQSAPRSSGGGDVDALLAQVRQRRVRNPLQLLGDVLRVSGGGRPAQRPDPMDDLQRARALHGQRQAQERQASEATRTDVERAQRSDPSSPLNVRYRAGLSEYLGVPVPDDVTVADAELSGIYERRGQARDREEQLRLAGEQRLAQDRARAEDRTVDREDRQTFASGEQDERIAAQERLAQMRRRHGGAGGGGPGPGPDMSVEDQRQAVIDGAIANGIDRATAESQVRLLGPRELRRQAMANLQAERQQAGAGARNEQRATEDDAEHRVPGWTRRPDAPDLTTAERTNVREAAAEARRVRASATRLRQLAAEITTMERAGARAQVLSPKMAEARALHETIVSALRVMGRYGAPVESELARIEALAPRLDSGAGWASAQQVYAQMPGALDRTLTAWMRGYGYEPERSGGGTIRARYRGQIITAPAGTPLPPGAEEIR